MYSCKEENYVKDYPMIVYV